MKSLMQRYRVNAHSKHDLKVHLVWMPKYRKPILRGEVSERARDILRQVALKQEVEIIRGKLASNHVHMFVSYRPQISISKLVQHLKGTSSRILLQEFDHLRRQLWGRHLWGRGYLAVGSGAITDEMIQAYIDDQEGEPVEDDSQFQIDP